MRFTRANLHELKDRIERAPKIIFHRKSHLDDAATQWFLREAVSLQTHFEFQWNQNIQIDGESGELGLDVIHEYAVKGYEQDDGGFSSAFRCVVEAFYPGESQLERLALEPILLWVDGDDSMGSATKAILGEEHPILEALGLTSQFQSYKTIYGAYGDEVINQRFGEQVLTPLYQYHLSRQKAFRKVRQDCEIRLEGLVGMCIGRVPSEALGYPQLLLREMAEQQNQPAPRIFLYRDPGMGLGLVRMDDEIRLDHPELQEYIGKCGGEGWFFHPGGFLSACGSGTTPRDPETIPLSAEQLASKLNEIYGEH